MAAESRFEDLFATARGLARRHGLVRQDGGIACWECGKRDALLPSLHCGPCLAAAWRKLAITDPLCPQREQTAEDRALMTNTP